MYKTLDSWLVSGIPCGFLFKVFDRSTFHSARWVICQNVQVLGSRHATRELRRGAEATRTNLEQRVKECRVLISELDVLRRYSPERALLGLKRNHIGIVEHAIVAHSACRKPNNGKAKLGEGSELANF